MATAIADDTTSRGTAGRGGRGGGARQASRRPVYEQNLFPDALTNLVDTITRGSDAQVKLLQHEIDALKVKIAELESRENEPNGEAIKALKEQFEAKHRLMHERMHELYERVSQDMSLVFAKISDTETPKQNNELDTANKRIQTLESNLGEMSAKHEELQQKFDKLNDAFAALAKMVMHKQ